VNLTVKQISILRAVVNRNDDGSLVDLDQLLDRIDYETTKASIQFSIRSMVKAGVIMKVAERRRGRQHVCYEPTGLGARILGRDKPMQGVVEDEGWNEILSATGHLAL